MPHRIVWREHGGEIASDHDIEASIKCDEEHHREWVVGEWNFHDPGLFQNEVGDVGEEEDDEETGEYGASAFEEFHTIDELRITIDE